MSCEKSKGDTLADAISRRNFLSHVTMLGAFGIANPYPIRGETGQGGRCVLTAADSLLLYEGLLDRVGSDAVSLAGQKVARNLEDCGSTLAKLSSLLKELRAAVSAEAPSQLMRDLGLLLRQTDSNLTLTRFEAQHTTGQFAELRVQDDSMASVLKRVAADCDLSKNPHLKDLIQKMTDLIDSKNTAMQNYQMSYDDWNKTTALIARAIDNIRERMRSAGSIIETNADGEPLGSAAAADAEKEVSSALVMLDGDTLTSDSAAKNTLKGVLTAIMKALGGGAHAHTALRLASYSTYSLHTPVSGTLSIDASQSTAMDAVRGVVRKANYFDPSPGGFWQVVTCVAICLPIWLAYRWPDEKETRVSLIRGSLFLVKGATPARYVDIATDLASAYQS
jgi:hypothetical protein